MTAPVAADPATVRAVLLEVIAEILPDVPAQEVLDERSLADLGADSVDRVEIITTLTHRLGSRERVSRFADIRDIGALVAHLSGAGDAR
ncbi:phosphopantetheine-binding protein [Streptomyces sp. NPDC006172]|uniref:phosphopantetheine-binding protein n=1 Tax=Streptomyces sp. NPDC006172 TaxID=3154470 RepID=UPI0033CD15CA